MATQYSESLIEKLDLDRFFDDSGHKYDLGTGVIVNPGETRVVYLSSDIIRGIYTALEYEAGEAWKIILKNCGYIWGKRVAENLDLEMGKLFKTRAADLVVPEYVRFVEAYFSYHGWGILSVNLDKAVSHGLVIANLRNSIFEQVLNDVDGFVDQMIEGMLRSLMEHISGRELDCLQVASVRNGAECCEFVVTAPERIEDVEEMVEEGASLEEIYAKLEP